MKSKLALLWFLVSVALTVVLVLNWRTANVRQVKLEALQLQFEELDAREKVSRVRVAELEKEVQRTRGELRAAEVEASNARLAYEALGRMTNAPGAGGQGGGQRGGSPQAGMGAMLANMLKDPEMRKAMAQQQSMGLDMVYGGLYKQLQLSPEQQKAFKDALLSMQMTNMLQASLMFDPGSTNRAAMMQQIAEGRKAAEDRIKEVLGEEKYGEFQDYNQTLGERMMLDQFSKQVEVSPEQTQQLLAIIREEKRNMQINMGNEAVDPNKDWQKLVESGEAAERLIAQQEAVQERVLERANQVLSPEQLEKFRPFMTNQMSLQRAGLKMARQMFQQSSAPQAPQP